MATPLVAPETAAARARAAIGYAGLEHDDIAEATGLSVSMIRRITSKSAPRDATIERLWAIADACGVPKDFMEYGWPATTAERLATLEAEQQTMAARLLVLEEEARQRTARRGRSSEGPTP